MLDRGMRLPVVVDHHGAGDAREPAAIVERNDFRVGGERSAPDPFEGKLSERATIDEQRRFDGGAGLRFQHPPTPFRGPLGPPHVIEPDESFAAFPVDRFDDEIEIAASLEISLEPVRLLLGRDCTAIQESAGARPQVYDVRRIRLGYRPQPERATCNVQIMSQDVFAVQR